MLLAPAASLSDADNASYKDATIVLQSIGANLASNRIELGGGFTVNASNQVLFNGSVFGTVLSNGIGANSLTIKITSDLPSSSVVDVLQSVRFRTVGATAAFSTKVSVRVIDPLGTTSNTQTVSIVVS